MKIYRKGHRQEDYSCAGCQKGTVHVLWACDETKSNGTSSNNWQNRGGKKVEVEKGGT